MRYSVQPLANAHPAVVPHKYIVAGRHPHLMMVQWQACGVPAVCPHRLDPEVAEDGDDRPGSCRSPVIVRGGSGAGPVSPWMLWGSATTRPTCWSPTRQGYPLVVGDTAEDDLLCEGEGTRLAGGDQALCGDHFWPASYVPLVVWRGSTRCGEGICRESAVSEQARRTATASIGGEVARPLPRGRGLRSRQLRGRAPGRGPGGRDFEIPQSPLSINTRYSVFMLVGIYSKCQFGTDVP